MSRREKLELSFKKFKVFILFAIIFIVLLLLFNGVEIIDHLKTYFY